MATPPYLIQDGTGTFPVDADHVGGAGMSSLVKLNTNGKLVLSNYVLPGEEVFTGYNPGAKLVYTPSTYVNANGHT